MLLFESQTSKMANVKLEVGLQLHYALDKMESQFQMQMQRLRIRATHSHLGRI